MCTGWPVPKLPAAATTTTPLNQSFSTALSSGLDTKCPGVAECSEKFATPMLYLALFARIHWQAEMTSLVIARPWLSMTRIDTMGALGPAPEGRGAAPPATPATNVPWPRPSPNAVGVSELRLTWASTRFPKSGRVVSMPESTIAIAGPCGFDEGAGQRAASPDSYGQSCVEE